MTIRLHVETGPHHLAIASGEPLVVHCNHYNAVLQQSIEDAAAFIDMPRLLRDAGASPVFAQLSRVFGGRLREERLAFARAYFARAGFGLLDLSAASGSGGFARVHNSHYGLAFRGRKHIGARPRPACYFAAGYIEGALAASFDLPLGSFEVEETGCVALGAPECVFAVERRARPAERPAAIGAGSVPDPMPARPSFATSIDEPKIVGALSQMPMEGNEEGMIPAFGVYLTRHYANYYCHVSYELERRVNERNPGLADSVRAVLAEAGHVCAFHTFGGIMTSAEWEGLVLPMIRGRADWVYGITACINTLGWGRWTAVDLKESERLVVRVDGGYESNHYLAAYGSSAEAHCHFLRGAVAGVMNLLYVGDITQRPVLDMDYYEKLFSGPESFRARETRCRSKGDAFCEVVAERVVDR